MEVTCKLSRFAWDRVCFLSPASGLKQSREYQRQAAPPALMKWIFLFWRKHHWMSPDCSHQKRLWHFWCVPHVSLIPMPLQCHHCWSHHYWRQLAGCVRAGRPVCWVSSGPDSTRLEHWTRRTSLRWPEREVSLVLHSLMSPKQEKKQIWETIFIFQHLSVSLHQWKCMKWDNLPPTWLVTCKRFLRTQMLSTIDA